MTQALSTPLAARPATSGAPSWARSGAASAATAPRARRRNQIGAATAEYAVVTAAGCGFGAVLLRLLMSDWGQTLLKKVFSVFMGLIGLA